MVLALIGIITGIAVLGLPNASNGERQQRALDGLQARLNWHSDAAVLTGETRGLRISEQGYQFLRHEAGAWHVLDDGPSDPLPWPGDSRIRLSVEGRPPALEADDGPPQILLLATGETTPFTLELQADDAGGLRLSAGLMGDSTLEPIR